MKMIENIFRAAVLSFLLGAGFAMTAAAGPASEIDEIAAVRAEEVRAAGDTAAEVPAQDLPGAENGAFAESNRTWQQTEAGWILSGAEGERLTGWQRDGSTWYYLDPETGIMKTGWIALDGKHYYLGDSGAMQTGMMARGDTIYTFGGDGSLSLAKKRGNTDGGAYELAFYEENLQQLADNLNEYRRDFWTEDEEDDEDESEEDREKHVRDFDKRLSFQVDGYLQEAAEKRMAAALEHGYGSGTIPGMGTIKEYMSGHSSYGGRTFLEVWLMNCDTPDEAEERLEARWGERRRKRADQFTSYRSMGMAYGERRERGYYLVIFMR